MNMRHAQAFHTHPQAYTNTRTLWHSVSFLFSFRFVSLSLSLLLIRGSHFVFGLLLSLVFLLSCDAFRITERVRCICFTFYYATLKCQTEKTATQNSKKNSSYSKTRGEKRINERRTKRRAGHTHNFVRFPF